MAVVAQSGRAPDCGSGCRGFKSRRSPHFILKIPIPHTKTTITKEAKTLFIAERLIGIAQKPIHKLKGLDIINPGGKKR